MNYKNLFLMALISFISMYILMYMMVDKFSNVYSNINQLYMAGIMTLPMILIELFFMRSMYPNKKLNNLIILSSILLFIMFIFFERRQVGINDKEFLKSMIPHHAAALLMCRESHLRDPEIIQLCKNITESQQSEIVFMKNKLAAMR